MKVRWTGRTRLAVMFSEKDLEKPPVKPGRPYNTFNQQRMWVVDMIRAARRGGLSAKETSTALAPILQAEGYKFDGRELYNLIRRIPRKRPPRF